MVYKITILGDSLKYNNSNKYRKWNIYLIANSN